MKTVGAQELRGWLESCLAVPRWVDGVLARGPFNAPADLLLAAREEATPLSPAEIEQALSGHPRIGEAAAGDSQASQFSRGEQQSVDAHDEAVDEAVAEGNRAYEERFGRIFLIRAAGRSRTEILTELNRRLELDDAAELTNVTNELRDIALLRLARLAAQPSG
ncbi:2-oxo-4-hydroxy-4-carboxy-5-ureidoimidazoline decarboxylase [Cryobacterium psychrophilum]|uniref:2-oxo-4-hydroxy-4-carboxy-5-ureidoimidazoline decarboxylase n=1 Tax=Cryobacterium psychrophilum TaxID=41988 RepID=A0A4Y8KSX3_9MICO|nr:2-oxo-4-hydroxy-4-carboxy-5-ureidoimidazoline decarboxylase [Cryobacterium psychrophilum]TDW28643.1 2-oxo-4-hydroxy-4-carboxy-5-ureidoimidazoline decarboxylase [Cryobacterium psychrophilum]TFD82306.1 2-oxo-4-hydroxy-4-carboxy-5-ureidoimidazoline decarboxylase [Cryobacterium psychrophilum]